MDSGQVPVTTGIAVVNIHLLWWPALTNQYGLLKQLRITAKGTFMDGLKLSEVTLDQVNIRDKQWSFKLSVDEDAEHIGGITLLAKVLEITMKI